MLRVVRTVTVCAAQCDDESWCVLVEDERVEWQLTPEAAEDLAFALLKAAYQARNGGQDAPTQ